MSSELPNLDYSVFSFVSESSSLSTFHNCTVLNSSKANITLVPTEHFGCFVYNTKSAGHFSSGIHILQMSILQKTIYQTCYSSDTVE